MSLERPDPIKGILRGMLAKLPGAQMTISAVEENGKITSDGKSELTATEISTISELDFISTGIYGATLDNQSSANITAGSSTKLQFSILVGTEEYGLSDKIGTAGPSINGYHVLRDGIFYACLPEGVSILGADQVKVEYSRKSILQHQCKYSKIPVYCQWSNSVLVENCSTPNERKCICFRYGYNLHRFGEPAKAWPE